MGALDKFLKYMQLNNGDDDGDYFDDEDSDYEDVEDQPVIKKVPAKKQQTEELEKSNVQRFPHKTAPARKVPKSGDGMEVCVIKPTSVDDSREITDTLLSNRTVVLNMEGLDVDIAQRIIDFASGSTYAMKGNLQKISHYIFIITPPSVDISGDFNELLGGSLDIQRG